MLSHKRTLQAEYIVRLERGEKLPDALVQFCTDNNITHASFEGIGAIKHARVGAYILSAKEYVSEEYPETLEVTPMIGNIAEVDGAPFVHAHVVLSDQKNNTIAGHLFEAEVAVTLEIALRAYNEPLARVMDDEIGLKLLKCNVR